MKKSWERYFAMFALTALSGLQAQPSGFEVVAGEASKPVAINSNTLQINTGKSAIIQWDSFSIGKNEVTKFVMPDASSAVLNRVIGKSLSELQGTLQANGKLFLINPNGILIGSQGQINVASFFASTLDVLNEDFMQKGELLFKGDSLGKIVNLGTIEVWDGDVVLIGRFVDNRGTINASTGTAALAVGGEVLLKLNGNERVFIRGAELTEKKIGEAGLENTGTISALQVELKADGNPYVLAIKDAGKIDALSVEERSGRVYLVAKDGQVEVTGSITAKGGETHVLGKAVVVEGEANIDVSGKAGGGTILLGGDYQGENPLIENAEMTVVGEGVTISANGIENGDGGKVILWGTNAAQFLGKITARGGTESGDGGFVEVSSHGFLDPRGEVDTRAPYGKTGMLLLDPCAVTISTSATSGATFSAGSYTFSGATANIQNGPAGTVGTLENLLGTSNVTINASTSGTAAAGSITQAAGAPVVWSANTTLGLSATDNAASFITLNSNIQNTSTSAGTAVVVFLSSPTVTIATGSGGVSLASGVLTINATNTIQVNDALTNTGTAFTPGALSLILQAPTINIDALVEASSGQMSIVATSALEVEGGSISNLGSSFTPTEECIVLVAPDITIGSASAASGSSVTAASGQISISGVTGDLILTGGSGSGANAEIQVSGSGTIMIDNVGGNLQLAGGTGSDSGAVIEAMGGDITLGNVGGGISMVGGGAANATAEIITGNGGSPGNVTIGNIGGTFNIVAGSIAGTPNNGTPAGIYVNDGGDITIGSIGGELTIGLLSMRDAAQIAILGAGNVTFTGAIAGDVIIQGGSGTTQSGIMTDMGSVSFPVGLLQNLSITGGSGDGTLAVLSSSPTPNTTSIASIGQNVTLTGGTFPTASTAELGADGDLIVGAIGGNILLEGGNAFANFGSSNGSVTIGPVGGNVTAGGGIASGSSGQFFANDDITFVGSIGGDLIIQGSSADGSAGFVGCNNLTIPAVTNVIIMTGAGAFTEPEINVRANISMLSIVDSLLITADLGTGPALMQATGNIDIAVGQNISLSSTNGSSPSMQSTGGSITTNSGLATELNNTSFFEVSNALGITAGTNVSLQNGSHFMGSSGPMTVVAAGDIILSGGSSYSHSGTDNLTVTAGGDISLSGASSIVLTSGSGNIMANAGHNISLDDSTISNAGSGLILGFAGVAAIITDTSTVNTASGNLTLVTDNDFPTPFGLGSGFLDLDGTSTIFVGMSAGPYGPGVIRLYTAIREQNTVAGLINGAPFVYGTEFVNTSTEQWDTWYPGIPTAVDPTPPITILYKTPGTTSSLTANQFGKLQSLGATANSQMFYMFDAAAYYFTILKMRYDAHAYAMANPDKGTVSSYDVDRNLQRFTMRNKFYDTDGQLIPNYVFWRP